MGSRLLAAWGRAAAGETADPRKWVQETCGEQRWGAVSQGDGERVGGPVSQPRDVRNLSVAMSVRR